MCQYSALDGTATDWHMTHLGMLANSGAALVVVEATHVERHGRITHGCHGLYSDANEDAIRRVLLHCRRIGSAKFGVQLAHSGRKGSSHRPWDGGKGLKGNDDPWETIAPSPIAYGDEWPAPREATRADMERVRDAFVNSAKRAIAAGFDVDRAASRAWLSAAYLPVADFQYPQRRVRRLAGKPHAVSARGRARGAGGGPAIDAARRAHLRDRLGEGGWTIEDSVTLCRALKARGLRFHLHVLGRHPVRHPRAA